MLTIFKKVLRVLTGAENNQEVQVRAADRYEFKNPDLSCLEGARTGMAGHVLFLYNLAKESKAQTVIEIGFGMANSALAFLTALQETGGKLISIDSSPLPEGLERIKSANLHQRFQLIQGVSQQVIKDLPKDLKVDILFIDGYHSYKQCQLDFELYEPIVRTGGFIIFHDSNTIAGVIKFTQELTARYPEGIQFPFCNGIFVLRKTW